MSPSFIVDTWRIWEWLITIAFRIGLRNQYQVIPQATTPWGEKKTNGTRSPINVFPDVAVYSLSNSSEPVFLVDAKYKNLDNERANDVERDDLYEAFAFCHATGAKQLFLAYPSSVSHLSEAGSIVHLAGLIGGR